MSRRYNGHKEPCKNLGLVVKNSVRSALSSVSLNELSELNEVSTSSDNPSAIAVGFFNNLYENLQSKLRDKAFDVLSLWSNLIENSLNPVDMLFPRVSKTHIWSIDGLAFIPNLSSQTTGSRYYPPFDLGMALTNGALCDQLIRSVVDFPVNACAIDSLPGFQSTRAKLFSLFLTNENPFSVCAYSPELTSCFESWVDELSGMSDEYKIMGVDRVLHCLKDFPGVGHQINACPDDFMPAARAIVEKVFDSISNLRIRNDLKDPHDTTELNRYGVIFDYLGFSNVDRVDFCNKIVLIGNESISVSIMDGLVRSPEDYIRVCEQSGLSGESTLSHISQNLSRSAWFNQKVFGDLLYVSKLVDAFRNECTLVGYPDPAGTIAFDFLTQNLDVAEIFEKKGFISREPIGRPALFLKNYEGKERDQVSPDPVIKRKIDLALRLNQRDLVKREINLFFKGHKNQSLGDFGTETAIRYVLESKAFDASEILINDKRRDKVMSMGVSGKALLPATGATVRLKAMAIEHDLGL